MVWGVLRKYLLDFIYVVSKNQTGLKELRYLSLKLKKWKTGSINCWISKFVKEMWKVVFFATKKEVWGLTDPSMLSTAIISVKLFTKQFKLERLTVSNIIRFKETNNNNKEVVTVSILSVAKWWWHSDDASFSNTHSQKALIHTCDQPANPDISVIGAHASVAAAKSRREKLRVCVWYVGMCVSLK